MAVVDPYVAIDAAYSDAVKAAVAAHGLAVAPANTQLATDLAAASEAERAAVMAAFEAAVAPARQTYNQAVAQAETTRQAAKTAATSGHQTHTDSLAAREANAENLRGKANSALAANATFLAIATPSAAQNTAQAKALTRQVNAIIKLTLALLDDVNGT